MIKLAFLLILFVIYVIFAIISTIFNMFAKGVSKCANKIQNINNEQPNQPRIPAIELINAINNYFYSLLTTINYSVKNDYKINNKEKISQKTEIVELIVTIEIYFYILRITLIDVYDNYNNSGIKVFLRIGITTLCEYIKNYKQESDFNYLLDIYKSRFTQIEELFKVTSEIDERIELAHNLLCKLIEKDIQESKKGELKLTTIEYEKIKRRKLKYKHNIDYFLPSIIRTRDFSFKTYFETNTGK